MRLFKHLLKFTYLLLCLCLLPVAPALAQERVQDEAARSDFIYRVNLGRADDVRLMIRQGASPNQLSGEGVPVLCLAAARVDPEGPEVIHALLDAGANLSGRDSKGQNALFYAARSGNIASINYLLEVGIDMYAIDNNGDVARTVAHKVGQDESIRAMDDYVLRTTAQITQQYSQQNDRGGKKKTARKSQDS
ncbi:MAG: ankyrin repeat domain-containing protein, partial [Proteobacteria bacterium]|nr:ankyrin repeat domain-containing protein [Pseudomonadota bacterium]